MQKEVYAGGFPLAEHLSLCIPEPLEVLWQKESVCGRLGHGPQTAATLLLQP